MSKFLVVCFLLGTLQPSRDEWPTDEATRLASRLTEQQTEQFAAGACLLNLYRPDLNEVIVWEHSGGAYVVLWRRAQGTPLRYPTDPTYGHHDPDRP